MSNMTNTTIVIFTTLTLALGWQDRQQPSQGRLSSTNAPPAGKGTAMNKNASGSYAQVNGVKVPALPSGRPSHTPTW